MKYWDIWKQAREMVERPDLAGIENKEDARKRYKEVALARKHIMMWWVIVLMGLTIIALISFIYCDKVLQGSEILKYVEFAATLLSIVLSIFAILYSYFSALEASRQWGEINKAVSVMEKTTETIEKNNETLLATVIAIHGEVNAMTGVSENANNVQENTVPPQVDELNNHDSHVAANNDNDMQNNEDTE